MDIRIWVIGAAALALAFVGYLMFTILRQEQGTQKSPPILLSRLKPT